MPAAVVLGGRREAESEREEELAGGACLRPAERIVAQEGGVELGLFRISN